MKRVLMCLVMAVVLAGCSAEVRMTVKDSDDNVTCELVSTSVRQVAMAFEGNCEKATIITGEVNVDSSVVTVKALGAPDLD